MTCRKTIRWTKQALCHMINHVISWKKISWNARAGQTATTAHVNCTTETEAMFLRAVCLIFTNQGESHLNYKIIHFLLSCINLYTFSYHSWNSPEYEVQFYTDLLEALRPMHYFENKQIKLSRKAMKFFDWKTILI